MTTVRALGPDRIADLETLFGSDPIVNGCWCMWHIVRVADFHAAGRDGNRAKFEELLAESPEPLGLVAYEDGEPVGWCAAGPRSRFTRALATPTLRGRDREEDDAVWLVPCFFVKETARRRGVTSALLEAAVSMAKSAGATAIEGFPDAAGKRVERGARGNEAAFASCGFVSVTRPSEARVIMRRALATRSSRDPR